MNRSWRIVVVDVEASGSLRIFNNVVPYHSLLEIGAVEVILSESRVGATFYAVLRPLSERYDPKAIIRTSGRNIKYYIQNGKDPKEAIKKFYDFLLNIKNKTGRRVLLASDNPEFDVGWIRLYLELFGYKASEILHHNPMSIKDLARGITRNLRTNLYRLPEEFKVDLPHTHNALDDAIRNAKILIKLTKVLSF